MAKKLCVVVNSRANYGRIKSVLRHAQNHPDIDLQLVVGASALLYRFGSAHEVIAADGFEPVARVYSIVEGENPTTMAKSTGLAVLELATLFENIQPDIVLTVADRFETIATAIAASYMNIPVAHTQGGEITGSIDESVRHAVTKLSHLHFPASSRSAQNIIRMGEPESSVFLTGCPSLDILVDIDLDLSATLFKAAKGVGPDIDISKPYALVVQHPVTTEFGEAANQTKATLAAIQSVGIQTVWLWPNVDAGSDEISKALREHRETAVDSRIHFYRNFSVEDYARVLNNCACIIGNSSSGIREASFLGVPAINLGSRQQGRERGPNVIDCPFDAQAITTALGLQLGHPRYPQSELFGTGAAGKQIVTHLAESNPSPQKRLNY